jgi:uncharacterized Zn finger protein (UPF0148 family)
MSSDDFDKEAEREKLRRKYEAEQEDRAATQRMSELLLQGATMTNRHCDTCGDPIFRYEGQQFCPSCQATAGGEGTGAAAGGSPPGSGTDPESGAQDDSPAPSETAPEPPDARAFADEERTKPTDTASQPSEVREPEPESASRPGTESDSGSTPGAGSTPSTGAAGPTAVPGGDLAGARDALAETVARLSRRAADAEDPRRAREFLEAAREASEVLRTLDGR